MPSCITAEDIEQLVQDIPVQPPVVVPVRTVQEAVAAGDLPPLDADAANVFSQSERILQDHVGKLNLPFVFRDRNTKGVVCASSTLLQLHLVSDRRQGVSVQGFPQGGVPGVFQHV